MGRTRQNGEKFKENPFLKAVAETAKTGKKKVFGNTQDKFMITDTSTGEVIPAGVYFQKEVEKNEFVKLYAEGAAAIMGLKSPGKKVFQIMYGQLLGADGKDKTEIILNYDMLEKDIKKWISRATFDRGINELLKAKFIAKTLMSGYYFINPAFIYNGNRLLIAKSYILKGSEKPVETPETAQIEAPPEYTEADQTTLDFDEK